MLSNFLIILVVKEKVKVKLALDIPTGAPKLVIQTPLLLAVKPIRILSMLSKVVTYSLTFLLNDFL